MILKEIYPYGFIDKLGFNCSNPKNCGVGHCKNIPPKIANDDNNSTKTTKIAILRAFGRNLRMIIPPAIVPIAIVKTEAAPKSKKMFTPLRFI